MPLGVDGACEGGLGLIRLAKEAIWCARIGSRFVRMKKAPAYCKTSWSGGGRPGVGSDVVAVVGVSSRLGLSHRESVLELGTISGHDPVR
jgi:hypothetical protein